ncbi:MAG: hypothetical protein WAV31_05410 [Candidatus Moraniibacteriota bacterium]
MAWLVKRRDGIVFNHDSGELSTNNGAFIASIRENEHGLLEIDLGMDTDFRSDDEKIHGCGWKCEEHMGCTVYLNQQGGTIEYEGSRCDLSKKSGEVIQIKIVKVKNAVPITPYIKPKVRPEFARGIFKAVSWI